MANTWTKLKDGNWGVRVQGNAAPGAAVTVSKSDGTSSFEEIASVVWTGPDRDGKTISLCSVVRKAKDGGRGGAVSRAGSGRCKGCRGPIRNAPHCPASAGYCGYCAFDEFDC